LICASKNGVFIDGTFQRKSNEPYKLPNSWVSQFLDEIFEKTQNF
jgi:hypothetical protein